MLVLKACHTESAKQNPNIKISHHCAQDSGINYTQKPAETHKVVTDWDLPNEPQAQEVTSKQKSLLQQEIINLIKKALKSQARPDMERYNFQFQ